MDDHGRFTDEAGLPNLTGKYVFDANARHRQFAARARHAARRSRIFITLIRIAGARKRRSSFAMSNNSSFRIDELRGKALDAIKTSEVDSSVGRKSHRRHGRIASRLGDFAPTKLGRAAPGFYSKDGEAILDAKIIRKLADLVAERGSNIWFELERCRSCARTWSAARHNKTQRHDRRLDRQRRFAQSRLRAASRAARSGRHVSRSDRSASRLVSIIAHDQRRAEQSRAVQNLRHARFRCRS